MPLENVVLQLKSVGIRNVVEFPFPTLPQMNFIKTAILNLIKIEALKVPVDENLNDLEDEQKIQKKKNREKFYLSVADKFEDVSEITKIGQILSVLPINPIFGKIILQGRANGVLGYI